MFYFYPYPMWMLPMNNSYHPTYEGTTTPNLETLHEERSVPNKNFYFDPLEGFMKGNLIKKEYLPYKNYKEGKLEAKNERESLLLPLMIYSAAVHDLALLLDVDPTNKENICLLETYKKKTLEAKKAYEDRFGALCEDYLTDKHGYDSYVKAPSPWRM